MLRRIHRPVLWSGLLVLVLVRCSQPGDPPVEAPATDAQRAREAFQRGEELRLAWESKSARRALDLYREALNLWSNLGSESEVAATLRALGKTELQLGQGQQALDWFEQALAGYEDLEDTAQRAAVINDLGRALDFLGRSQESFNRHEEALQFAREAEEPLEEALALRYLASRLDAWGEIERAVETIEGAVNILRELKQMDRLAGTLRQSARIYSRLGRMETSFERFGEALEIRRQQNQIQHQSGILTEIGWNHHLLGDHGEAIKIIEQAVSLVRSNGYEVSPGTLDRLGSAYRDAGLFGKSLSAYEQALDRLGSEGESSKARIYINLAELYVKKGEPETARSFSDQALTVFEDRRDLESLAHIHFLAGLSERDSGKLSTAQVQFEKALEIVESVRYKVNRQAFLDAYHTSSYPYYEAYVDLLMRCHRERPEAGFDRRALIASEWTRARRLEESLFSAPADPTRSPNLQELQRRRRLLTQIEALDRKRVELAHSGHSLTEIGDLDREQHSLFMELDRLMARAVPTKRLTSPKTDVREVQELLPPDSWLLYYFLGRQGSYLWVLSKDFLQSYPLKPATEIEALARRCHGLFNQKQSPASRAQIDLHLDKLAEVLVSPISQRLSNQRLLIAPDASLQFVPFAALPNSQGEALLQRHEIVHLPSTGAFGLLQKGFESAEWGSANLAIFADPVFNHLDSRVQGSRVTAGEPSGSRRDGEVEGWNAARSPRLLGLDQLSRLPYTRQEAEAILAIWPQGEHHAAFGFEASRQALLRLDLSRFQIVHFATHTLVHPRYPQLSGVVLSLIDEHETTQAGFLRAHEIAEMPFNADLVVLSACQTAMGKEVPGEGLIGLPQSFLDAGVPRVVVSLWNVSDPATAQLMTRFYSEMASCRRASAALRQAQLSMMQDQRWNAPFYWAPFIYVGRLDP